jgi:hypothetical protein
VTHVYIGAPIAHTNTRALGCMCERRDNAVLSPDAHASAGKGVVLNGD